MTLTQDITKTKKRLIDNWKRCGAYENFGQKEVNELHDKYHYLDLRYGSPDQRQQAQQIDNFYNWCMNYCGE